ncbi:MAG: glycine zipper 2TM domain-containing protein [Woeseia sp.]
MNYKLWIATLAGTALVTMALAAETVQADDDRYYPRRGGAVYDYAKVLSVDPNVRYVTVRTPVRECWEEMRTHVVERHPRGTAGGALVGAIVGGVVGHQFGSGRGRDAATVAGTLFGAAIGSDAARRSARAYETTHYERPVQRCETRYTSRQEERIESYHVVYRYKGQKYATDTPFDPGNRIRIRVDIRPVH